MALVTYHWQGSGFIDIRPQRFGYALSLARYSWGSLTL